MHPRTDTLGDVADRTNAQALLAAYEEVCRSYHAIDEFRMKLLGLLPLASLLGILLIGSNDVLGGAMPVSPPTTVGPNPRIVATGVPPTSAPAERLAPITDPRKLIAFVSVFAGVFTVALFLFEIRGIARCSELIKRGAQLERQLHVKGQFWVCRRAVRPIKNQSNVDRVAALLSVKLVACLIYSVVFAAWAFLTLHYGYDITFRHCAVVAVSVGLMLAAGAYALVNRMIPA